MSCTQSSPKSYVYRILSFTCGATCSNVTDPPGRRPNPSAPPPGLRREPPRRVRAPTVGLPAIAHGRRLHLLLAVPAQLGRPQRLGLDGQAVAPAAVADVLQRHRQVGRVQDED